MTDLSKIRLLVLDVDGVLTDGRIMLDYRGREIKSFHSRDGQGIKIWMSLGLEIAIITGRSSTALTSRTEELNIKHVIQASSDKLTSLKAILAKTGIPMDQVAAVGDDLPDLPIMKSVGYPAAVADSVKEVKGAAKYVAQLKGGEGAVREIIEHILKSGSLWNQALTMLFESHPAGTGGDRL